jgi:serine/threonine protein kinase
MKDKILSLERPFSMGILHRDLKPGNILLGENCRAMISDFGVSRADYGDGPSSSDTGTMGHRAPEQDKCGVPQTTKIDVYAFGVIVTDILGSRLAIERGGFGGFMQRLVSRCLAHDLAQRPSFHEILTEFLSTDFDFLPEADPRQIRASFYEVGYAAHPETSACDQSTWNHATCS